ncbi:hypothetical protein ORI89_17425 [Sphingobacterium sp. UT-1RO-CII-1]|uniref:hypothetical protein n=1 Tax=Sphingobacterium sp. UT-1RO-CII-1 TaxID=2995225 RepID=UPI002279FBD9|nr:hypothetical protein [Sphingobacterium sp. UT-1RO-CII-1]MCY4781444.1 hypothetical protein [Sphingobacterium sp. UT-1RO-CII-1]
MNTKTNQVAKELAEVISDKTTFFKKVKIIYPHKWQRVLSFLRIIPRTNDIILTELYPGTVFLLLSILIDLRVKGDEGDTEELSFYKIIKSNIPLINKFIAVAINNKVTEPPKWLYDAINYQLTKNDLEFLVNDIYRRLDVEIFFGIMASLRKIQEIGVTLDPEDHTHS